LCQAQYRDRLRETFLNGMIKAVSDDFFFSDISQKQLGLAIFDDLRALPKITPLLLRFFYDEDLRQRLGFAATLHFQSSLQSLGDSLLKNGQPRKLTLPEVERVVERFVDVAEKLDLLTEHLFPDSLVAKESFTGLLQQSLSHAGLAATTTFASYVGRCIEQITIDREHQEDHQRRLFRMRPLIRSLPASPAFSAEHFQQLYVRLFHSAGLQYRIEDVAFGIIGETMPLIWDQFRDSLPVFVQSEKINKQWQQAKRQSPLTVLVFPQEKATNITTHFSGIKLPESFNRLKQEFEAFYRPIAVAEGGYQGELRWVYEENFAILDLKGPGYETQLTVPVVLAAALMYVKESGALSVADLQTKMGLPKPEHAEALAKSLARPECPILLVTGTRIAFNPAFRPRGRKIRLAGPANFGLARIVTANADDLDLYQAYAMQILKKEKVKRDAELLAAVKRRFEQKRRPFDPKVFGCAMAGVERTNEVKKDKQGRWVFVPVPQA
jgi:hypothetical protein